MDEKRFFNLSMAFQVVGIIALVALVTYCHFNRVIFADKDLVSFFKMGTYFLIEVVVARIIAKKMADTQRSKEISVLVVSTLCVVAVILLMNSAWHLLAYQQNVSLNGVYSGLVTYGKAIALDIRYTELTGIWRYPAVVVSFIAIYQIAKHHLLWKTVTK